MSQAQEIHFFYDKSRHFRVVHVDGAHGGLAPSGSADEMNITVSFYNERRPIPREEIVTVADGNLTGPPQRSKDSKDGVVREVEFCAVMSSNTARILAKWLNEKVAEADHVREELRQRSAAHTQRKPSSDRGGSNEPRGDD